MKKTLATINNQLAAINPDDIKNAKKLLKKVDNLKKQQKIAKTETIDLNLPKAPSAASQVKEIIDHYAAFINTDEMILFTQIAFSKVFFNLRYPLFVEITNDMTDEQKKTLRFAGDNRARYGITEYQFDKLGDRKFYITNDIYQKNVEQIRRTFFNMFE